MVVINPMHETRKRDHIELAQNAQTPRALVDQRFNYEPLLSGHPGENSDISINFLGKKLDAPMWISSMTGGVGEARHINQNLARLCREFNLGMGLGSCRSLLESNQYFEDFNLRPIIGPDLPLYANLGIAQLEVILRENKTHKISELCKKLQVDGLFIHINPMQEWFQVEGDHFQHSPIETLTLFMSQFQKNEIKIIVKEVGQGMGPLSLKSLFELPIDAFELAGFGGTNFSKLEVLRSKALSQDNCVDTRSALFNVGHTPLEMIDFINALGEKNPRIKNLPLIISGGIENFLDGHYLRSRSNNPSVYGHANKFLSFAEDYELLKKFTDEQVSGLKMAKSFLTLKEVL